MSDVEVAQQLFAYIEANDLESAAAMLTDDFTFSGPVPEPVSGQQWLGLHAKLNEAFPDFSFNLDNVHQHGDVVHVTAHLSGTQENTLDLSPMGLPTVPPTGTHIQLPAEEMNVSVVDGMVQAVYGDPVAGGGLAGMLAQLGVEPPPHDH